MENKIKRWSNPEYRKLYMAEYYLKHKKHLDNLSKKWQQNNKQRHVEIVRKSKFGLSAEEQRKILLGMCEICKVRKATHIDHDHKTNKVRGGLCNNCNTGLGMFCDNIVIINSAAEYLKEKLNDKRTKEN